MKTPLKWITGIIFWMIAMTSIVKSGVSGLPSCVLFIFGGLICFPPTLNWLEEKFNSPFKTGVKYSLVIGLFVLGGAFLPDTKESSESELASTENSGINEINNINQKEKEINPLTQAKEQLKREISSFDRPFNPKTYRGTIEALQIEIVLFGAWANVIKENLNSIDNENKKLATQLKKKVIERQVKELPQMRKEYARVAATKLWESDIYVTVSGNDNSIINYTGGIFASNKNIAEAQRTLSDLLTQLRFKQVRYRWYKGAEEFTYYDLQTPKDNSLITFE